MAYTLEPLTQILERVLSPDHQYLILDSKPQIQSLLEKVVRLKTTLENFPTISSKKLEILESKIIDAAHKAENVIESHVVHQLAPEYKIRRNKSSRISSGDLQKVMADLDSLHGEMTSMLSESRGEDFGPKFLPPAVSSIRSDPMPISSKETVVGLEEDMIELRDRLADPSGERLRVISIVGMGGIGKTTLARNLCVHPYIREHFDLCAWVTIPKDYDVGIILQEIRNCLVNDNRDSFYSEEDLRMRLYKRLMGRRYLIVIDGIWSIEVFDSIKNCFPNNYNRSRILLTTRRLDVANSANSYGNHQMRFLSSDESWELLNKRVFGKGEYCPPELDEIGKRIAEKCMGLPLGISVIAGLLCTKFERYFWSHIAENVSSILIRHDAFSEILSTSYSELPHHLKPCFLYMGAFPAGFEVHPSKLVRLWVAEGFIRPTEGKNLEEVGKRYLEDLVDRNMILVARRKSNGKVKTCVIHDLFRDVCLRQAREEKFLGGENWHGLYVPRNGIGARRVSAHPSHSSRDILESGKLMSFVRSFLYIGRSSPLILSPVLFRLRLLRILDVYEVEFPEFPSKLVQLVNLRFLAITCRTSLPVMTNFWNLQTLIFREISTFVAKNRTCFWEMTHLRHAKFKETYIRLDPDSMGNSILDNLQTLSTLRLEDGISYNKLFHNVPNLKKLGVSFGRSIHSIIDLSCLKKLETLKCLYDSVELSRNFLSGLVFPPLLKKLTLVCDSGLIDWRSMRMIGCLPHLEELKIRNKMCEDSTMFVSTEFSEWEPVVGEFRGLQFLLLENLNIVQWRANRKHFPRLRNLVIRQCPALKEIPSSIGQIPTLEKIELDEYSTHSAVASAMHIMEEQQDMGNDAFQVRICRPASL